MGITDALGYEQTEIEIGKGEILTLYTDGINESIDADGAFYTIDRLRGHLKQKANSAEKLGQTIIEDVRRFLGRANQNDDMCLVCFGRKT